MNILNATQKYNKTNVENCISIQIVKVKAFLFLNSKRFISNFAFYYNLKKENIQVEKKIKFNHLKRHGWIYKGKSKIFKIIIYIYIINYLFFWKIKCSIK